MLSRFLAALIFVIPLIPAASFAHDGKMAAELSEHVICQQLLQDGHVFEHYKNAGDFRLDLKQGFGPRLFMGQYPAETVESTIRAFDQGLLWWDYSITIAKSIEEARAHDAKYNHLYKTAYLIADLDVTGFTKDTPRSVLTQAFSKAFEEGELIEFSDYVNDDGKKYAEIHSKRPDRYLMEVVDKEKFRRMVNFDDIYFARDYRGARFKFLGWTFPVIRGLVRFDDLFKLNQKGWLANPEIRVALRRLISFIEEGGSIVINGNFEEALDRAVHMERDDGEGNKIENSRYIEDPQAIPVALELYKQGRAFSVEARDKNGKLLAGEICYRTGNLISGDTVFFDDPHLARAVIMAGVMRLHRYGIEFQDVNVVTKFTKQAGGIYVAGDEFSQMLQKVGHQKPVNLRADEPFSLSELPYPYEERSMWLEPHGSEIK